MSRRLSLTFDNGPTPGVTEHVLAELAARAVLATFFVVGRDLERDGSRELVQRAKDAGHRIGNHTMTHSIQFGTSDDPGLPDAEITAAQVVLGDLAEDDRLFRPWGGGGVLGPNLLSPAAVDLLERDGYTLVLWNGVPRDWEDATGWVDRALADIESQDWTVLVLHDIQSGAMAQLGQFLDRVIESGVEIVQDLPDACVPIRRGKLVGSLDDLVTR
ncbi:polysaccharide deacetylase family protein [Lacisediminihabitans profunda]|uniref:Polysaccharide deacetylase family protein n=1 Tax=Lacisediminihabitans profunda TaxID=2594790 RepID=A0A5C8UQY6_9MICO|nr:polysaccharide deacetylase family protein [Lacisediminihabitans profunda]